MTGPERNKQICRDCRERPAGCWKAIEYGCQPKFRAAERRVADSGDCPLRKLTKEPARDHSWANRPEVIAEHIAAYRQLCREDLTPPADLAGDGIVTSGEGRYALMISIACRIAREAGCTLPIQVWGFGPAWPDLDGLDIDYRNILEYEKLHPSRHHRGFEVKSYAVLHSGFRRVLWLDADAYLVRDPRPLFGLLDESPMAFWSGPGDYFQTYRPEFTGVRLDPWACEINGGQYMVDLADPRGWHIARLARWADEHVDYYGRHNRYADECCWRMALNALDVRPNKRIWRFAGPVMVSGRGGQDYIVHRLRRQTKLLAGTRPRRVDACPLEARVFELFRELSPRYEQYAAGPIVARDPARLRAERQAILAARR